MRLLIVEDHPAVAKALSLLLMAHDEIAVAAVATNVAAAMDALEHDSPDVVLCDVMLDGSDAGLDLLRTYGRRARFLMYSAYDFPAHHARAMRDGAAGFVSKTVPADVIFEALHDIGAGRTWFPQDIVASAASARPAPTRRERELLVLLDGGATNEDIGVSMGLRIKSVEGMFRRMFARYHVENRTQLARLAAREGWLTADGGAMEMPA
jgi:DNA-binding NarL/FixJ family response regulator